MLKSDQFPVSQNQSFFQYLDQFAGRRPSFGNFSDQVHKIDNLEDYLNFSWKFDNSCLSEFEDKFSWLENMSLFSVDIDDKLSSHYDSTLIGLSTIESKLKEYLHGTSDSAWQDYEASSWKLPDYHPLKVSMTLPGVQGFAFNTNWYQRLQSSFRNLWLQNNLNNLNDFTNDNEYSLLRDVGLFSEECKNAVTKLLVSLLSSNFIKAPEGFYEVTEETFPMIYKFHRPKFQNDRVFVYDGVVFTLVLGNSSSYSKMSYTTCKKLYSNDLKGRQALSDAVHSLGTCSRFAVPFYCVTDFMGFRVACEPLIPLSSNTKFFLDEHLGCDSLNCEHDAHTITTSLLSNYELANDLIKLSDYLKLSSWPMPFGSSDLKSSVDFNNHCNAVDENGTLHFTNAHEVLPPFVQSGSEFDPYYKNRFRHEFCTFYYKGPLKCSFNSQSIFNKSYDNSMFQTACEYNKFLLENNIDKFHTMTGSWDVTNTLHSFGLNIKNLGKVYERTTHSALKDLLASEMVARAFKHVWDLEVQKFIENNNVKLELLQELFFTMVNDLLGLTLDSMSFWYQKIHPHISTHFNVVDLHSFNYNSLPQMLLVDSLEFNLGVVLPKPENGKRYKQTIKREDFENLNHPWIFTPGCESGLGSSFYPKVSVAFPKFNLSIYKAASKLSNHEDSYGYSFLLNSTSFGMGLPSHFKSKIVGSGYPCDPICVYNPDLLCSRFNHHVTGINLYCLAESLLQTDWMTRFKLLLTLGYSFFQHRFYSKALEIARFLVSTSNGVTLAYIEAKMLEIQCYSLTGNYECVDSEYFEIMEHLKNLEGFDGFLKLQLLMTVCYDAWNRKQYKKCASYINEFKESFLHLFSVKNYEWVPVFFLSLLGYCTKELNVHFDSTKVHHELVRLCNLSNVPTYTKCNLLWLLLESLIRVGSYDRACKISTELCSIFEERFGTLSMEYLRALYVSSWINRQIGSIHFIHPYLYLSNSDNLLCYKGQKEWFDHPDLIMEELSSSNNSVEKRNHLKKSQKTYITLLDKLFLLSRRNKKKLLEVVHQIDLNFNTKKIEKKVNITREDLVNEGSDKIREGMEDSFLKIYLDQSKEFQSKMMSVAESFLTLKILSMNTNQCLAVANKLYNAYATQVSSEYTRKLATGPDQEVKSWVVKQNYQYGTRLLRKTETFLSHVSIKNNIIPRSGHDLRSVELLLMGEPEYSKENICEKALSISDSGEDMNSWFDSVFDFIHPKCVLSADKFLLSLDILRNFSTPCQRLFILGHLARVSRSDLNQTVCFKSFKRNMLEYKNKTL